MTLTPEKTGRLGPQATLVPEKTDRTEWVEEPEFAADWYEDATAPWARWPDQMERRTTDLVIAGYVLAVLIPILGFIIGLTQITRNVHGIRIAWLSFAVLVFGVVVKSR